MSKVPTKILSITYGDELIKFEVVERLNSSNKILIKVHSNCMVVVSSSPNIEDEKIINAVQQRGRWIYKQLKTFREQRKLIIPRQYRSGESHYYLGKQYQLKVVEAYSELQGVKLFRGKLEVTTSENTVENIKYLLNDWYRSRAKVIFESRLQRLQEEALWVEATPTIRLLMMHTQWGNCSSSGVITLNPYLVKASSASIDYVILHELCHLIEHNHSDRFYQLLNQVMPDWEQRKKQLDSMANLFLH